MVEGSRSYSPFVLLGLCVLCVYSFERGQGDHIEMFGAPYFVIDYEDGFIKRGLIGQIFLSVFDRSRAVQIWQAAQFVHRLVAFGILVGFVTWVWSCVRDARSPATDRLLAIVCVFASGQFLPTLAATAGYLDVYVFALIFVFYRAIASKWFILAAAVGLIGPYVHEMFVFYVLPVALLVFWRRPWGTGSSWRHMAAVGSAFISTISVAAFSSPSAAALELQRAPLTPAVRAVMLHDQFGQTILHSFIRMLHFYIANPVRFVLTFLAFMVPALGMLILLPFSRTARPNIRAMLILATLAPLSILLFAWDLSRLVVAAQFTASLCLLLSWQWDAGFWQAGTFGLRERRAACIGIVILLCLPFAYGYFDMFMIVGNSVLDNAPVLGPRLRAIY